MQDKLAQGAPPDQLPDAVGGRLAVTTLHAPRHIALVGNYVPRKCGLATFTTDVHEQLARFHPNIAVDLYVLDDPGDSIAYAVDAMRIVRNAPDDFAAAARRITESGAEAVWLQHEYGIFGGEAGAMVTDFVDRLAAPLILTLHTVLEQPNAGQRRVLDHLIARASRIMVMSAHARDMLAATHHCPHEMIAVIEHGAPDRPFGRQQRFKAALGLADRPVMMTFGLLGPGKGLEQVIDALPAILAARPDAVYRIVGATHPNLVARDGEAYREGLQARARELGVDHGIEWENRFLDTEDLLDRLEACDIYITPYFNLAQSTSGTLSYAVALGKAVVSTPYQHARELLADGVGKLIEPRSPEAIAGGVIDLLADPGALLAMQRRAYERGRETIWPRFADASAALIASAIVPERRDVPLSATPGLSAVFAMSDGTGMLQHGIGIVPDRRHGYCLDDNARALMLMNVADGLPPAERMRWSAIYAGFIQHAWNADAGIFRNFMAFDRSWCEDRGSDDANGRAIWALGHTAEHAPDAALRDWATILYDRSIALLGEVESPRAIAFGMLGAAHVLRARPGHDLSRDYLERGALFLDRVLGGARRPDWAWFETVLGYDNPRLSQALIEAGIALGRDDWLAAGLETLRWVAAHQVSAAGFFRPVGSESFGRDFAILPFDQQPLEAQAAIEACRSAHAATGDDAWVAHAETAYRWFFGANDRGVVLADLARGSCRDGINPRGANHNSGAESILALQLSHYSLIALARARTGAVTGALFEAGSRLRHASHHP